MFYVPLIGWLKFISFIGNHLRFIKITSLLRIFKSASEDHVTACYNDGFFLTISQ